MVWTIIRVILTLLVFYGGYYASQHHNARIPTRCPTITIEGESAKSSRLRTMPPSAKADPCDMEEPDTAVSSSKYHSLSAGDRAHSGICSMEESAATKKQKNLLGNHGMRTSKQSLRKNGK